VAKGIPTLIVAVAGICDAISVALFGIISSLMFATGGLSFQISQGKIEQSNLISHKTLMILMTHTFPFL